MREIYSEIEIESTPQKIWKILTQFENYPEWNPHIRKVNGQLESGNRIEVELNHGNDDKAVIVKPYVLKVEPLKELSWLERTLVSGLMDGQRMFQIRANGNSSATFIHKELYSGLLTPFIWNRLKKERAASFKEMNVELKKVVEN